jgi:hypothetical protein
VANLKYNSKTLAPILHPPHNNPQIINNNHNQRRIEELIQRIVCQWSVIFSQQTVYIIRFIFPI